MLCAFSSGKKCFTNSTIFGDTTASPSPHCQRQPTVACACPPESLTLLLFVWRKSVQLSAMSRTSLISERCDIHRLRWFVDGGDFIRQPVLVPNAFEDPNKLLDHKFSALHSAASSARLHAPKGLLRRVSCERRMRAAWARWTKAGSFPRGPCCTSGTVMRPRRFGLGCGRCTAACCGVEGHAPACVIRISIGLNLTE